jgi:hypothetical protein
MRILITYSYNDEFKILVLTNVQFFKYRSFCLHCGLIILLCEWEAKTPNALLVELLLDDLSIIFVKQTLAVIKMHIFKFQ